MLYKQCGYFSPMAVMMLREVYRGPPIVWGARTMNFLRLLRRTCGSPGANLERNCGYDEMVVLSRHRFR
jgi:hypothetical protein